MAGFLCGWLLFAEPTPSPAPRDADGDTLSRRAESGLGEPLISQARLQRERGDYAGALATVREGLALADAKQDRTMRASFLNVEGRIYWALADFTKAIELHFEELKLAEALQSVHEQAAAHHGLSVVYGSLGDGVAALDHIRKALALAERADDKALLAFAHNGMGNMTTAFLKDYAKAREHHLAALRLREEIGDRRGVADSNTNLAIVAQALKDPEGALVYLGKAQDSYVSLGLPRYEANTHWRMSGVLRELGRKNEALAEANRALELAGPLGSQALLASVYRELSLVHESLGDLQRSLDYERLRTAADASARDERTHQRTAEMQARYESERREHEISRLRAEQVLQGAENRKRRSQTFALSALLAVVVSVMGGVVIVLRLRVENERKLRVVTDGARERAEAAERLKSRLLMIASHDLKTPLASMVALADLLAQESRESGRVAEFSAGIKADALRMNSLVRDFLDAAAIEDGRLSLERAPTELNALARASVNGLKPLGDRKGQRIQFYPSEEEQVIRLDAGRIRQILDNLIGNAVKFTPPGGRIEVSVGNSGRDWLHVQIADTGPGLGPADMARIFRPFQRLSARPTGEEDSSGLGLFITRELLAAHGGRLEVESQPGKGSVFRILLPRSWE